MYNLSQLSEMLGVETVKIHELFVINRVKLKPYTSKQNGITVVSEEGYKLLSRALNQDRLKNGTALQAQVEQSPVAEKKMSVLYWHKRQAIGQRHWIERQKAMTI